MSTVAEQLRQGREARHLTIQQVAEITKIRIDHLHALEQGNFDVFSAPVYIRGFVRSCSTLFKLDVPQVMADLDKELRQTAKFAEPPALSKEPRGMVDSFMLGLATVDWRSGLLILGFLALAGVMLAGFLTLRHYQTNDPLRGLSPGTYHSTSNATGQTLPLPAQTPRH